MKKIFSAIMVVVAIAACATTPKDNMQRLYVTQWTLTGAANAVADLKPVIAASDYAQAKSLILVSNDALSCWKKISGLKVETMPAICPAVPNGQQDALGYAQLIQANLMALSAYYAAKGE